MEDQRIQVPGGEVFVRRWLAPEPSNQPTVVLLHDSLGCVELWRDFPAQLAEHLGRDVVAYDRLGFGQSSALVDRPSPDFIDEEAAIIFPAVCHALGLKSVIPFGHSVGGGMALTIANMHAESDLCAGVVTEAAQVFVEERTKEGITAAKTFFHQPGHLDKLSKYHGSKARWVLDAWTETWLDPRFETWNLTPRLEKVQCPVLAIHGDNDEFGSVVFPKIIAEEVTGHSRAIVLEGFGHVPHKEDAATVLEAVSNFFSEVEALASAPTDD